MSITHIWDESMRVLPLTPEEEFEFREVAGEYEVETDFYTSIFYKISDGYEVVKYLGHREVVSIPAQYKGKPVVVVGKYAFNKEDGIALELRQVEIPGTCVVIGQSAFYIQVNNENKVSLEKVILHRGLKLIDSYAFASNKKLSSIQFPKGLIEVRDMAFFDCDLKNVCIPASCMYIGNRAFSCNYGMSEILFPSDARIVIINELAFNHTQVYRIKLPGSCRCHRLVRDEGKKLIDKYGVGDFGLYNIPVPDKLITIERY